MGANCSRCGQGSTKSELTLADLNDQPTDLKAVNNTKDEAVPSRPGPLRPSEILARSDIVLTRSIKQSSSTKVEPPKDLGQEGLLSYRSSNILWCTGSFSDRIPNGFYSVIRDDKLKHFENIPTLDEIRAMVNEGVHVDVVMVDFAEDKKLDRLKNLISKLVIGLNSNPVKVIKRIVGLVTDISKQPTNIKSPKTSTTSLQDGQEFQILGEIEHGTCRLRAILFKVLADTIGIQSKLIVGFPSDVESTASHVDAAYNHMSIVVMLNNMEMLVDLMRYPGRLIPLSSEAICMAHISADGKEYYCHSPLEPNSAMYNYMDQVKINENLSRSEPNIAIEITRCSGGKVIRKHHTANSSPEQTFVGAPTRFMLNDEKKLVLEFTDDDSSESAESTKLVTKRIRRRHSETPEINNDIPKEVQTISEPLKQSRFSNPQDNRTGSSDLHRNYTQKAISLQPSPQNIQSQTPIKNISNVSPMFQNKPLLPYDEWYIDFSELKVGMSIGKGCFGEVYRGIWKGTDIAIKMFRKKNATLEEIEDFYNEISILCRLRHPNVILFLGACTKSPKLSLITEYIEKGSLYHVLYSTNQMKNISWGQKLKMLRDICKGLMYIHRMGIVHRDLKSANCLMSKDLNIKICDFGLSIKMKNMKGKDIAAAGTHEYVAPEVIRNQGFSEKCDIFSFGVVMWELCTLTKPWQGVPKEIVLRRVGKEGALLEIPKGPLEKLISDCWLAPEKRPSCEEILTCLTTCEMALTTM